MLSSNELSDQDVYSFATTWKLYRLEERDIYKAVRSYVSNLFR